MQFIAPILTDPMRHPKEVRRAVAQEQHAIWQSFREHNDPIRPLLPPDLQLLQQTYLHDAWVRSLTIDPTGKKVQLCLRDAYDTPDPPHTFFDLHLTYHGMSLTPMERNLLCLIAREPSAEIYWDEIDIEENGENPTFLHRILWQTRIFIDHDQDDDTFHALCPEIELRFGALEASVQPTPQEDFDRKDTPVRMPGEPANLRHIPLLPSERT